MWRSDIRLGGSGGGWGLEGWLCGPVSGGGRGGAVLGGVWMVSAMALAGVPLGSCVVFIWGIRSGSGGLWVDGVAGHLVFFTCAILPLILSCLWLL